MSNPAAGFIREEINGLWRARGGFPLLNPREQHKLLQKWVHLKKSPMRSTLPLTEHVSVSLQINQHRDESLLSVKMLL